MAFGFYFNAQDLTFAVTGYLDPEIQALTGSAKERKVLKTRGREFLCSRIVPATDASDSETKYADGLAPTQRTSGVHAIFEAIRFSRSQNESITERQKQFLGYDLREV